jgi:CheY-like chemotaxis protein
MNTVASIPQNTAPEASASLRILVVDDEQTMQILASTIIRKLGYQADAASSGEEAVELFRQAALSGRPYAAVVMDLALPGGISGLEATLAIKQVDGGAKVIVSSGYLEQHARNAALEHGFAGILPKPYTAERLASELRWVMKGVQ